MVLTTCNGKYMFEQEIANGGCGSVFLGVHTTAGKPVAIKLEATHPSHHASHPSPLKTESKIYKSLSGGTGVPWIIWSGRQGDYNVMVTDLMGPSLEDLFKMCNRHFSLKTVLLLADQLITRIEYLHSNHIAHRDIKPANFVMSVESASPCSCPPPTPSSSSNASSPTASPRTSPRTSPKTSPNASSTSLNETSTRGLNATKAPSSSSPPTLCPHHPLVHIIDFGLAKKFRDPVTSVHIPYNRHPQGLHGVGTSLFASINTHLGVEVSRRDDLESLAYMLIYFLRGTLPWRKLRAPSRLPSSVLDEMNVSGTEERLREAERYNPVTETWNLIRDAKIECEESGALTKGLPEEFDILYTYARGLEFDDLPDYEGLRACFRGLAEQSGVEYDGVFDWMVSAPKGEVKVGGGGGGAKATGKGGKKGGSGVLGGKANLLTRKVARGRHCVACEAKAKARAADK